MMRNNTCVTILGGIAIVAMAMIFFGRSALYSTETRDIASASVYLQEITPVDDAIVVYYHERRPYYVTTPNQVHGLIADRVNWVFKDAGINFIWRKAPAKRQLEIIRNNEQRACAVGWYKTSEREAFGNFTLPIYLDNPTMAIARADNDQIRSGDPLARTLSNHRLRLLRKDGYSYGRFIDDGIKEYAPRDMVTTADNLSMIKMIHTHRADYFFISKEEAEDLILCSGLPAKDFRVIGFSDMPHGNKRYLICSPKIEEMMLLQLNRAIKDYLVGSMTANPTKMRATP
jgi:polar amino acid transport system substrate-binding protein